MGSNISAVFANEVQLLADGVVNQYSEYHIPSAKDKAEETCGQSLFDITRCFFSCEDCMDCVAYLEGRA